MPESFLNSVHRATAAGHLVPFDLKHIWRIKEQKGSAVKEKSILEGHPITVLILKDRIDPGLQKGPRSTEAGIWIEEQNLTANNSIDISEQTEAECWQI